MRSYGKSCFVFYQSVLSLETGCCLQILLSRFSTRHVILVEYMLASGMGPHRSDSAIARKRDSTRPFRPPGGRNPAFAAPVAVPVPRVSAERHGFINFVLGAFALMLTVPVAELLIVYLHFHIPVVVIDEIILTCALFMSGRVGEFWRAPVARPWVATLVLFSAAAVFGDIKGISIPFIFLYGIRFHVVPFYCCALALTARQVRAVLVWVGWGSLVLLFLCAAFGVVLEDRFLIPDTTLENPNDLAFALLFTMSCLVLLDSKISRIIAFCSCPVFLYYILKTGSRANLITLVIMLVVVFFLSPPRTRIMLAVTSAAGVALVATVIPAATLARLTLIVYDPASTTVDARLGGALASQAARVEIQKTAIDLAERHPLLGVGANTFELSVEQMVRETTGGKSGWHGAHNSYLEVAAENGFPAFIFYIASVLSCCSMNFRTYKLCRREAALASCVTQSLALILMTIAFMVGVAFSNDAYSGSLCLLVGMSAANFLAVRRIVIPATPPARSGSRIGTAGS
jgi:O-antigen ligase